jgi:alanyl-tRNA synthetase
MAAASDKRVVAAFDDADARFLRAVAKRVTSEAGWVALVAAKVSDGLLVLAARGEGADFDCGGFIKRAAALAGGRGGGRAEMAEGRLPASADWTAIVRDALSS